MRNKWHLHEFYSVNVVLYSETISTSSFINPFRRKSMEQPPRTKSAFDHLEKELIKLFKSDYPQLQQCMENIRRIIRTFHDNNTAAVKGTKDGAISGAVGGTAMAVGLALAPFTFGISALIGGAGAAVATGGAIGSEVWKKKKANQEEQLKKDLEADLRTVQDKIIPMAKQIKDISERIEEILTDLNKPEYNISYLSKYFTSACELVHFLKIYDIGGLAKQISKSVNLTEDITDFLAKFNTDILQHLTEVEKISQLLDITEKIKETTDNITNY